MQNDGPIGRTNVRELPVMWLGHRDRANVPPSPGVSRIVLKWMLD
jgi:hypothetical protein